MIADSTPIVKQRAERSKEGQSGMQEIQDFHAHIYFDPDQLEQAQALGAAAAQRFGMPVGLWLRSFPSNPQWASVDGINGEWVERSWRAHKSGSADNRMMLWCWLSLQGLLSRSEVSSMAA